MSQSHLDFSFRMSYLKDWRDRQHLPPRPPRFSLPSDLEHPLPPDLHTQLGTVGAALGAGAVPSSRTFGVREQATLAHYSIGLMRYEPTDPYPIHRPAPSPRCLHASELYLVRTSSDDAPLQRYHPVRHSLEPVHRDWLWAHTLPETPLGHWLISLQPDRIAFLYGQYAHRLALLEAGHVVAQLRALARGFGWDTRIRWLEADTLEADSVARQEIPLAVLTHVPDAQSHLEPSEPLPTVMRQALHAVMLRRNSGHGSNGVNPLPVRLSQAEVATMARFATADLTPDPELGLELRAVMLNVDGLKTGAYKYTPSGAFELLRPLENDAALHQQLFYTPGFKVQHCPVVWFVVADLPRASRRHGSQAYARVQTEVGQLAHRLGLVAAAHGLFARPSLSYQEANIDQQLRLHVTRGSSQLSVLMGKDRELGFPIRLSL
jgi:hypothetical protein